MNIADYLTRINNESQQIFAQTIINIDSFGKMHHMSACIFEFSDHISDSFEKEMLGTISAQLESSYLNLALGLYRQAFASLRLALELGLGVTYFSVHRMEHYEWMKGETDIKWSKLIDSDNGVLSVRFANAFFPDLVDYVIEFNDKAKLVYRTLSEFVHGNKETWIKSGIVLKLNEELLEQFFNSYKSVSEVILFALCCRYLKTFNAEQLDSMEFIPNELNYISPIRELFGGPKQI